MTDSEIKNALKITRDAIAVLKDAEAEKKYYPVSDAICRLLEVKMELKTAAAILETDCSSVREWIELVYKTWVDCEVVYPLGLDEFDAVLVRMENALGQPTYLTSELTKALDIDTDTLNKYAGRAGVTTPKRGGGKTHRYTERDRETILKEIANNGASAELKETAKRLLEIRK